MWLFLLQQPWVILKSLKVWLHKELENISDIWLFTTSLMHLGQKPRSLLVFHSFTSSDTMSYLFDVFLFLYNSTTTIVEETLLLLEHVVVLLYDWTSSIMDVNSTRKELFTMKGRQHEAPPLLNMLYSNTSSGQCPSGHCCGSENLLVCYRHIYWWVGMETN